MENIDIVNRFTYHPPTPDRVILHNDIRADFRGLALELNKVLPEGREKALAITKLEEGMMWANAAVARQ